MQVDIECGFTLNRVRDMTKTYSQKHGTEKKLKSLKLQI